MLDDRFTAPTHSHDHFRQMASDILLSSTVAGGRSISTVNRCRSAMPTAITCAAQSVLLAPAVDGSWRWPIVTVVCAAGESQWLGGGITGTPQWQQLQSASKRDLLPPFDRAFSALLSDLFRSGAGSMRRW